MFYTRFNTLQGEMLAFSEADQLTGLYFSNQKKQPYLPSYQFVTLEATSATTALFQETRKQVNAYFDLALKQFDLPLNAKGSEFQQQVWQQLTSIPYGETVTYKWMADQLKKPKAVRAIAQAIGKNPLILCNPCHRVIATSGKLAGYSAGIEKKAFLLHLESSI
ncbi:methylated-DNA--[protein]-cysteine S-methyltransferase [Motilimonas cestriensis]|uniref:Methylated-DNA--[protein]-cysteine S-methyltransferase n=1 Tax=Motilimonas cestriensis TaxID=2742685 RepID=A0ABS8WG08_9GAMM|nr:methylated-DNA--[protein]-cysteine S-methyltransferase [Motilimonas cestriensis]